MASFPFPSKETTLGRMQAFVGEQDIDNSLSGAGGRNVSKVSSCVLRNPSGIRVKCQQGRSQGLARRMLLDKIEEKIRGSVAAEEQRIEKIRRQKRKRSRRAKQRMLDDKQRHGEKKQRRAAVRHDSNSD
jgi:protein subunit release factor B